MGAYGTSLSSDPWGFNASKSNTSERKIVVGKTFWTVKTSHWRQAEGES
jgi:hypothetical protein